MSRQVSARNGPQHGAQQHPHVHHRLHQGAHEQLGEYPHWVQGPVYTESQCQRCDNAGAVRSTWGIAT